MTKPTPREGTVVGGRYRLLDVLGHGGMAIVWRAAHTETDREVALKLVKPELAMNQQARELFVREARVASKIGRSEHIVDVLDAGIDAELALPFMAMELLEGEPLDERLRTKGPLRFQDAVELLEQIGDALDQAHGAGIVHRDLKPQNLFLTRNRKNALAVKILDFGIAKAVASASAAATEIGTPAYSAPEQLGKSWRAIAARNGHQVSEHVSAATDVWALGLVAYEMLTGASSGSYWGAATLAELPAKVFLEPLQPASMRAKELGIELPAGFDAWHARCLELDAAKRWPSAGEAVRALAALHASAPDKERASAPLAAGGAAVAITAASAEASGAPGAGVPPTHVSGVAQAPAPHAPTAPHASATAHAPHTAYSPTGHASTHSPYAQAPTHGVAHGGYAAVDPRLSSWASSRGIELRAHGDVAAYRAWAPFQFVPPLYNVGREGRIQLYESSVVFAEALAGDELKRAVGEGYMLIALVTTARSRCRAAVRPKHSAGLGDSLSRGLKAFDDLVGTTARPAMYLGDPWFDSQYEVASPSPQELHMALTPAVRQALLHTRFRGVVEMRPGGLVAALEPARFDPVAVDHLLDAIAHVLAAMG